MYAIKTVELTKKYKDLTAVDKLNLQVKKGELFSLLGVNGAGKTTVIKMLSGLIKSTSGDAFIEGNSILQNAKAIKNIIGLSPQETAIAPNLSVKENLELFCGVYGFSKERSKVKIKEISEQFKLHDIMSKKTAKLSGGWQRRLSIAIALIGEPSVLFLDEPTLGLDVIARSELWDIINSLKGRVTVILTTHYMEEAQALSDRIGIMKDGKLLITGSPDELMKMTSADTIEKAFISIVKEDRI